MEDKIWQLTLARVAAIAAIPDDDEETRLQKAILSVTTVLISIAGVVWGLYYVYAGEPWASTIPFGYTVLSAINLFVLSRTLRFGAFRFFQILLTLLLPLLLMLVLGGYINGSAMILWSFLAPLGALLCWRTRPAVLWFFVYLATVVAAGLLSPLLRVENNLSQSLITTMFVLNIAAVSSVAFIVLLYFVKQKELAMQLIKENRKLELANLEQERLLRQSERLATLGRLSAGVAHELNNPAAAAQRGAAQLRTTIAQLEEAQYQLGQAGCLEEHQQALRRLNEMVQSGNGRAPVLDAITRSDREEEMERQLEDAGIEDGWEFAPILVGMGYTADDVTQLSDALSPAQFAAVVAALSSTHATHSLLDEIGQGASRITEIVRALKTYTYLDQAPLQFLDVHEGLENTLVMLRSKLKKGVDVQRDYAEDLPTIQGYGGELNQVWTNLIDNAVEAMDGQGTLRLHTRIDGDWVAVEISDDGPGIPKEVEPYIFDPFYTTKPLGQGTGLGLNISRNIVVQKHGGDISVHSHPGRTTFTVKLPIHLDGQNDDA